MSKVYRVWRDAEGTVQCSVRDRDAHSRVECAGYHSPTGFETGYGGSGPSDLALSILLDYFGVPIGEVRTKKFTCSDAWNFHSSSEARKAWLWHNDFMLAFIAHRDLEPGQEYEIPAGEIGAWFDDRVGEIARQRAAAGGKEVA